MSNYRPISNLSLISKIIERVILLITIVANGLPNLHQSAYTAIIIQLRQPIWWPQNGTVFVEPLNFVKY